MKIKTLRPEYVANLPERLDEGVLYISEEFAIAGHSCCCGCGEEVITPLNRAQWRVIGNSESVSLYPSIGNWKFSCKSHYWIRENRVFDAPQMGGRTIKQVQQRDRRDKDRYVRQRNSLSIADGHSKSTVDAPPEDTVIGIIKRLRAWWRNLS